MGEGPAANTVAGHERRPGGPLAGITVVDLSSTFPGAQATQFLADAGADVVQVEPPGGSPLRDRAAWPALARGKRSISLDLHADAGRATLNGLIATADVFVMTLRPQTAARLRLAPADLAALNPRLVSAAITGFGASGPWAHLKGYEGMVMAKLGMFQTKSRMVTRPGPAFVSVPYAGWGASQTAVHGILTALFERASSGRGQHVEADMVRGVTALDTWTWFTEMVGLRWPDAYQNVEAFTEDGEPQAPLVYPLLIAPTKDGHWLQFAQTAPRLFAAMLKEFGLTEMLADPKWKGLPVLETQELRTELWEIMIRKVQERTLAEWQQVFDTNPDIMAEVFRAGPDVLNHPQLDHDRRVAEVDDPEFGRVVQPSTLVHENEMPLSAPRPAPREDEHGDELRQRAASAAPASPAAAPPEAPPTLPLEGLTILELGTMFAGPYGATVLTDFGARVIKVEAKEGDGIRNIGPFPESGGAKVLQGKESVALDLTTEEGLRIVRELAAKADVVLQSFRAGAAERAGVDAEALRRVNPDLIYVNAPGYGTGGPSGKRPAYAPSIGAAFGLALTDAPDAAHATESLREIKAGAMRLQTATAVPTMQADGIAALGVASTILLGALARRLGRPMGQLTATMVGSATHAILEQVVDYPGRAPAPAPDPDGHGFNALYRMYEASEGWVFLAAPEPGEWEQLAAALAGEADLGGERFATREARRRNDEALAETLAGVFSRRPAGEWEALLTKADVGCVQVTERLPELLLQTDEALAAEYCVTAANAIFDEHLRMGPLVRFSRSATRAEGGCSVGEHTDAVLSELGYDESAIAALRERGVIG
ncbi:CaiB/BaiF CoA transferase family protein [Actinomadura physcomitrii]|uniref:CaiB/BaiF CoA transferase family protein n=1 Tax=Actinomadura physcomitrii TaxID=2650748 RepID=UPI0019242EB7|nr:CoA transferase [Actinomadura physcomitrii]